MARLHVRQSLTAVTGACMFIARACVEVVGDFDEKDLGVAYNDVDFCLRAVTTGYRVVWTPFATLIHHQLATRGSDETKANRDRFARDKEMLRRATGPAAMRIGRSIHGTIATTQTCGSPCPADLPKAR